MVKIASRKIKNREKRSVLSLSDTRQGQTGTNRDAEVSRRSAGRTERATTEEITVDVATERENEEKKRYERVS